jgi:hypothetical protein
MTQQSTPETEPAELTGTEGFRAALAEPNRWEASDSIGVWHGPRGELGWLGWCVAKCSLESARWRRIPDPKPVDSELPAEMTADQATEWTRLNKKHSVIYTDSKGKRSIWWLTGAEDEFLPTEGTYTPLVPLTRGQLERITELEAQLRGMTVERDSAIGSQKAALAALEQERGKTKALRLALADLLDMVHCEAAQNAERVLSETAWKESGG